MFMMLTVFTTCIRRVLKHAALSIALLAFPAIGMAGAPYQMALSFGSCGTTATSPCPIQQLPGGLATVVGMSGSWGGMATIYLENAAGLKFNLHTISVNVVNGARFDYNAAIKIPATALTDTETAKVYGEFVAADGRVQSAPYYVSKMAASAPTAGARLWLRADAGVVASAGRVSSWQDQSGNGNHATMSNANRQPFHVLGALNGKPVVRFNGAQSLYLTSVVSASNFTIFVAGKNSDANGNFSMILGPGGNSANDQLRWENGTQALMVGTGNRLPVTISTIGNTRTYHTLAVRYNAGTLTFYRDGSVTTSTKISPQGPWTTAQIGGWFSSYFMIGDLAEVLIYDTALSDTDRASTQSYLASKYGLP